MSLPQFGQVGFTALWRGIGFRRTGSSSTSSAAPPSLCEPCVGTHLSVSLRVLLMAVCSCCLCAFQRICFLFWRRRPVRRVWRQRPLSQMMSLHLSLCLPARMSALSPLTVQLYVRRPVLRPRPVYLSATHPLPFYLSVNLPLGVSVNSPLSVHVSVRVSTLSPVPVCLSVSRPWLSKSSFL